MNHLDAYPHPEAATYDLRLRIGPTFDARDRIPSEYDDAWLDGGNAISQLFARAKWIFARTWRGLEIYDTNKDSGLIYYGELVSHLKARHAAGMPQYSRLLLRGVGPLYSALVDTLALYNDQLEELDLSHRRSGAVVSLSTLVCDSALHRLTQLRQLTLWTALHETGARRDKGARPGSDHQTQRTIGFSWDPSAASHNCPRLTRLTLNMSIERPARSGDKHLTSVPLSGARIHDMATNIISLCQPRFSFDVCLDTGAEGTDRQLTKCLITSIRREIEILQCGDVWDRGWRRIGSGVKAEQAGPGVEGEVEDIAETPHQWWA